MSKVGEQYELRDGRKVEVSEIKAPYSAPQDAKFLYCRFLSGDQMVTHAWWNLDGTFGHFPELNFKRRIK